jgi:hypothetical protein
MSDEQRNEENEVEAHGPKGHTLDANNEPRDEAETDDEVEAHGSTIGKISKPRHMD